MIVKSEWQDDASRVVSDMEVLMNARCDLDAERNDLKFLQDRLERSKKVSSLDCHIHASL